VNTEIQELRVDSCNHLHKIQEKKEDLISERRLRKMANREDYSNGGAKI